MKYCWGEFISSVTKQSQFQEHRKLTLDEFEAIQSVHKIAESFLKDLDYLLMINEHYTLLNRSVEKALENRNAKSILELRAGARSVSMNFLNLIGLVRIMKDHLRVSLDKHSRTIFERIWSRFYDNYFEFRFFERLRNYSQHQMLPISDFWTEESKSQPLKVIVHMDRDTLLQSKYWSSVKTEIEAMEQKIDVLPMLKEYILQVNMFFSDYLEIHRPDLTRTYIYQLIDFGFMKKNTSGGHYGLFVIQELPPGPESGLRINIHNPHFEYIELLPKYLPNIELT